uniref:Polysacc_synt_C domain-containing protein n=1 Tax=Ascaris lumbricoides TaxID=6252 RepID=A0A0M3I8E8_ASCLU
MQQFEKFAQRMAVEIPELVDQFKHETKEKVEDIITAVQDQAPIPDLLNFHKFFVCFFWIAIMIIGFFCGEIIGSQLIEDILSLICDRSSAIALNYFLIPLFVYIKLGTLPEYDRRARFTLLAAAILQGILTGFLLMNRLNVLLTPLQLANILYIAIVSRIIGHKLNNDRQAYYGIINGIAFAIFISSALIFGTMTKTFLANAIYAVISSHIVIQVYMRRVAQSELKPSFLQLALLNSSIYAQTFIRLLLI